MNDRRHVAELGQVTKVPNGLQLCFSVRDVLASLSLCDDLVGRELSREGEELDDEGADLGQSEVVLVLDF